MRAVSDWAAMPHERNATSTTAANGLADHEPKEVVTAVVTGSRSAPATIAAGSGCASVTATAFSITSAPTLRRAIQIARGTWCAASLVSSEAATQASNPMNTQPPTASAASSAANTEPPDRASAPSVWVKTPRSCSRNTSSSARPIPTEAIASAAMPSFTAAASTSMPSAPTPAHTTHQHHARGHDPPRRGLDPGERERPGRAQVGDRRVRDQHTRRWPPSR